jgi:signal transduction histidine kinase
MTAKKNGHNRKSDALEQTYERALHRYLAGGAAASLKPAVRLGRQALALDLETMELSLIHERSLIKQALPLTSVEARNLVIKRATRFFAEAVLPLEATHRAAREVSAHLSELNKAISQHTRDLLGANRKLKQEIARRKTAEQTLRKSRKDTNALLAAARRTQKQLQMLSRRILSAQEEERKQISRDLHDVVAQMLNGINLRLAELRKVTASSSADLDKKISHTQRLVEESVDNVHRFARQLRPAMLDLGLIPAIETLTKSFARDTGIRVTLDTASKLEELNGAKRTALFRITQEALANVARHAKADRVRIRIHLQGEHVHMSIKDNGKSFNVERVMGSGKVRHLGLLGIKERAQMLGDTLEIQSAPGKGTDVCVAIPLNHSKGRHERS